MGAKFVAGIVGVIIVVVLAQSLFFGGDDDTPSINRPGSIPTATPPADQGEPVLLGQGEAAPAGGGSGSTTSGNTYTVQSGDTLGAIAAAQGVSGDDQPAWIAEVLRLNDMQDARQLQSGQELRLPARQGAPAPTSTPRATNTPGAASSPTATVQASATGTVPTPTPRAGASGGTYIVVSGDYPFLIAQKHCVDDPNAWVEELLDINGIDATSLAVGAELDLPPGTPPFCGLPAGDDDDEDDEPAPTPTS